MDVGLLTLTQKNLLVGGEYDPGDYFNPIQDCNGNWIISSQEIDNTTNPSFDWVNSIPLINYCPIVYPPLA